MGIERTTRPGSLAKPGTWKRLRHFVVVRATLPEMERTEQPDSDVSLDHREPLWRTWLWVILPFAGIALFVVLSTASDRGLTQGSLHPASARAHATIESIAEGDCLVGVRHASCQHLELAVERPGASPMHASLDVNILDRWAFRFVEGATIDVVVEGEDVVVDVEPLH